MPLFFGIDLLNCTGVLFFFIFFFNDTRYHSNWTSNHNMLEHNPDVDQRTYRYMSPSDPQLVLPFGHGLSLTTFKLSFSNPGHVDQGIDNVFHLQTDGSSSSIQIEIGVQNIGAIPGDEVVQAFSRPIEVPTLATVPIKSLFHFVRVHDIEQEDTATVRFDINCEQLVLVTQEGDRVVEPGLYDVSFENGAGEILLIHIELMGGRVVVDTFPVIPV